MESDQDEPEKKRPLTSEAVPPKFVSDKLTPWRIPRPRDEDDGMKKS